ncbi:hypothetical protein [Nocardioides sp. 1609]|uniref:hypothetical protein n=1 Tax=Nocardioides sp. 1609 TaxID=2508327 RepID=UPI00107049B0|nr:hypothetical protein [Nocardioides sp. 1609]
MRMFRTIAAVAALVMAATMTSLVASPTHAAAPAKPKHNLSSVTAGNTPKANVFYAKGKIKTLKKKNVILQRANGRKGNYSKFKVQKTNAQGGFKFLFSGRPGQCFKVVAPPTPRNRSASKFVGCITRG